MVDTEKLAFGLKQGIKNTPVFLRYLPNKYMLRMAGCGLVSSGIQQYLQAVGVPCSLGISTLETPDIQHVFPRIGDETDPTIVDAVFSRLLECVGICSAYEDLTGINPFPDEEILVFRRSDRNTVVQKMTALSLQFQADNLHPTDELGRDMGSGPLAESSGDAIAAVYGKIWDPANTIEWGPPEYAVTDGKIVARYIPLGSITLA